MSHITEILVGIKDLKLVSRIAKKHGYTLTEKSCTIQGTGMSNKVDAYLNIQGSQGKAVGFRKEGNSYVMSADMYGVNTADRKFVDSLRQEYAVAITKQELLKKGFNVSNMKTLEDGSISINLTSSN
jgi:hypothetical protein